MRLQIHRECELCASCRGSCILPNGEPDCTDPDVYLRVLMYFRSAGCVVSDEAMKVLEKLEEEWGEG